MDIVSCVPYSENVSCVFSVTVQFPIWAFALIVEKPKEDVSINPPIRIIITIMTGVVVKACYPVSGLVLLYTMSSSTLPADSVRNF